jgi:hypothetical protein
MIAKRSAEYGSTSISQLQGKAPALVADLRSLQGALSRAPYANMPMKRPPRDKLASTQQNCDKSHRRTFPNRRIIKKANLSQGEDAMRKSLMLLTAAAIVVIAPVAANAGANGGNSATHVTCRGTEWHGVGYAGCTQALLTNYTDLTT